MIRKGIRSVFYNPSSPSMGSNGLAWPSSQNRGRSSPWPGLLSPWWLVAVSTALESAFPCAWRDHTALLGFSVLLPSVLNRWAFKASCLSQHPACSCVVCYISFVFFCNPHSSWLLEMISVLQGFVGDQLRQSRSREPGKAAVWGRQLLLFPVSKW